MTTIKSQQNVKNAKSSQFLRVTNVFFGEFFFEKKSTKKLKHVKKCKKIVKNVKNDKMKKNVKNVKNAQK